MTLIATATSNAFAVVIFNETFTYATGSLTANSGGNWNNHSGTAGQMDVLPDQTVSVTEAETEDTNRAFAAFGGSRLYCGMDLRMTALPSGAGGYFAHFKDSGTTSFRARVFSRASTTSGKFNLGISNASNTAVWLSADFNLNQWYRVVFSSNLNHSACQVEVIGETAALTASDATSVIAMTSMSLRQSLSGGNGMGKMVLDNITVTDNYMEAVPEPTSVAAIGIGVAALLSRKRKA